MSTLQITHTAEWDNEIETTELTEISTLEQFEAHLAIVGDALSDEEIEEINQLVAGQEMEIERGRGCWYTIIAA